MAPKSKAVISATSVSDPCIGKIYAISATDFVTYDRVQAFPGEHLNIIIGPNGTGKSTLVAAIILGLGGNPKVLSRSSNIRDYIKNGKETATITIRIYKNNQKELIIFNRTFDIRGGSVWLIDNNQVTQNKFQEVIAQYNIQIDNLCQFLPQDRVQDFAKMNPHELLLNTQSSVCQPDINDAFTQLKEFRNRQKIEGTEFTSNKDKLTTLMKQQDELKGVLKKSRQRENMINELNVCNKKKAWMEFEEVYIKCKEIKSDLQKANLNYKQCEDKLKPLRERSNNIERNKNKYESELKQKSTNFKAHQCELEQLDEQTEKLEDALNRAKGDLEHSKTIAKDRKREIEQALLLQIAFVQDVKDAFVLSGPEAEKNSQLETVKTEVEVCRTQTEELNQKRSRINQHLDETVKPQILLHNKKISAMQNIAEMKLDVLRNRFDHVFRAVLWLRSNIHLFEGKVYEPMILELNLKDKNTGKYFENLIAERDLIAFTCERKDDMSLLYKKLKHEKNLMINILHSDAATSIQYKPQIPIESLREYGCYAYLIDKIEGPFPILNYLCRMNNIHNVPLGNEDTYNMIEKLPHSISMLFTENHRFAMSTSKYSGERSSMCNEIRGKTLLTIGTDIAKLEEEKRRLNGLIIKSDQYKNERIQLEDQMKIVEVKCTELYGQQKQIMAKFNVLDACKDKLKKHILKLQNLQENTINNEDEKDKFLKIADQIIKNLLKFQTNKTECYKKYSTTLLEHDVLDIKIGIFKRNNLQMKNEIKEYQEAVDKAKKYVTKINDILNQIKRKCAEKQSEASQLTNGAKPTDPNFAYKTQFDELPDVLEELMAHMDEIQGRIDCLGTGDESRIADYERNKIEIANLKGRIENANAEKLKLAKTIDELHEKWYPVMINTVDIINNNFSTFMCSMNFVGEVELVHKNEHDYDDYGIQIRVKYRNNEKLQALDRYIQSGGERAVAIAIYTMSLQHISNVPFRCVDEINQGMDPTNERKIFNMLVEQTAQAGKSQYFFVTPKLLPKLNYNSLMTVLIVHNGPFCDDPDIFVDGRI